MTVAAVNPRVRPDDLLHEPDGQRFEFIAGAPVEKSMGQAASWIAGELASLIRNHIRPGRLGWMFPADTQYRCFPRDPDMVRRPDASFIRAGRLPAGRPFEGFCTVTPDLVVEVVSPNETFYTIDGKVRDYLAAGVPLIWVVNPDIRTVSIFRADGSAARVIATGTLSGEDVLPGFTCRVAELFPDDPAT